MNTKWNKKLILFVVVFVLTCMTTLVAYAEETELTAAQWMEKGDTYQTNKDFENAILAYNQAISLDSQMEQAYVQRGKAYLYIRQYNLAIADFTKSIEMDSQKGELYLLCGLAYAGNGEHQAAINDYNQALRINSKLYIAYCNLGLSYEKIGSYYLAMQSFQSFLKYTSPNYPNRELAKKHLENLQLRDKAQIQATQKSLGAAIKGTTTKYIFNFMKKDYLSLKVDKPRWKIGYQQANANSSITELVSGNETVENWTELITVRFISETRNITPRQYASFIEQQIYKAYGDKVQANVIRVSDSDVIMEYKVSGQAGVQDEYTIMRIFRGNESFGFAMYATKPSMTVAQRKIGLSILEGIQYSDHFPNE